MSVISKFYCPCLENLKESVVSINATRLKENLIKVNQNLETNARQKQVLISFKDNLAAALEYFREHLLQNNAIYHSGAAHIWNETPKTN